MNLIFFLRIKNRWASQWTRHWSFLSVSSGWRKN